MLQWWCEEMTQYMKHNHKWRNRSGAAERGIAAHLRGTGANQYVSANKFTIELRHGETVWYGWRLEYLYQRRYAIIEPTLDAYSNNIINSISLDKLYFGNAMGVI